MVREVLSALCVVPAGRYVDATVGFGGHARAILESAEDVSVLGIDRDADALEACRVSLGGYGSRVRLVHGSFGGMAELVREHAGWADADGVLIDCGVSSHQLDTPVRGFSFRVDGPLDMRMSRRRSRVTAAALLNRSPEDELARIFREYGEERQARRLARAVVERREQRPWSRTLEFAELVTRVVGRSRRRGPPAPTRCFMALRIAVNDELDELSSGLAAALSLLRPGGRLVVLAFHSLEDRIIKRFFLQEASDCVCPAWFPECRCDKQATVRILTRKPIRPSRDETAANRRASPARLRAAEKLTAPASPAP